MIVQTNTLILHPDDASASSASSPNLNTKKYGSVKPKIINQGPNTINMKAQGPNLIQDLVQGQYEHKLMEINDHFLSEVHGKTINEIQNIR